MEVISRTKALKKGLKFYFTNKPCKYGHVELRRVDNWCCTICYKAIKARADKKYSQKLETKEIRKAIYARYRKTEKYRKAQKKYRKSEKAKETRKKYEKTDKAISYRRNVTAKSYKKKASDYKYRQSIKGILARRKREKSAKHMATKLKWRKTSVKGQKMMMWANLRSRLKKWTTSKNLGKRSEINKLVGCSKDYLRKHIEKQFKSGMTWENHGRYGWHIDHIIPLSKFDPKDPIEVKKANHYSNLQPLWAIENLKKNKY